jgi:hypothetical protein
MNETKMQIGVGELKKVFDSCKGYAIVSDYVIASVCGYKAGHESKDAVLDAVSTLRKEVAETINIYEQIEHACESIEDSIKKD